MYLVKDLFLYTSLKVHYVTFMSLILYFGNTSKYGVFCTNVNKYKCKHVALKYI